MIEKRAKERIPASIDAKHFVGNSLYAGTVKNLSENGIYINSDFCLPTNSLFELLISLNENVSNIPVKVRRAVKEGAFYNAMGIEVLKQPKEYLEFVNRLKTNGLRIPLIISDETLKQTTKCQSNFRCLTDHWNLCVIDRPVNGRGLFIKKRVSKDKNCQYMEPHGQARGTIITPRWGEHPVPEYQFTHGQGRV